MRTALGILLAAAVTACASSGSDPASSGRINQTFRGGAVGNLTIATASEPIKTPLAYPLDSVWLALGPVLDTLGIPVLDVDKKVHRMGNGGQSVHQRLGKTTLSRLVDCGQTQIGPNADSYDVVLTVTSTVSAPVTGSGSVLATLVEAVARPMQFNQAYSQCTSKGELEKRIATLVQLRLAK